MPNPNSKHLTSLPIYAERAMASGPRTIVCFGTARGGTSMVAGAVMGLGIPMGEGLARNVEDPAFNRDQHVGTEVEFLARVRATIAERDAAHELWGWKFPFVSRYLEAIIGDLRAPHLVCVYRDPIPMALRARPTMQKALDLVAGRLRAQVKNTLMIEALGAPCLMVSYEKASAHPLEFIEELAAFLTLPVPSHVDDIVAFMSPGSYKDPSALEARITAPE